MCSLHVLHRAEPALGWLGEGSQGVLCQSWATMGSRSHRREPGLWVWPLGGTGSSLQATLHTCWLALPSKTTEQSGVEVSTAKIGFTRASLGWGFPCPLPHQGSSSTSLIHPGHISVSHHHPSGPESFCWALEKWNVSLNVFIQRKHILQCQGSEWWGTLWHCWRSSSLSRAVSEPARPTQGSPAPSCTVLVPVPLLRRQLLQSRRIQEIPASGMQTSSFYPIKIFLSLLQDLSCAFPLPPASLLQQDGLSPARDCPTAVWAESQYFSNLWFVLTFISSICWVLSGSFSGDFLGAQWGAAGSLSQEGWQHFLGFS